MFYYSMSLLHYSSKFPIDLPSLISTDLQYIFSVTLDKTKEYAHMSWAYHRFLLVNEYSRKSPLPPPINLLYYIGKLIKYLVNRHQNKFNSK